MKFDIKTATARFLNLFLLTGAMLVFTVCNPGKSYEVYHKFEKNLWPRFDILKFEIPINEADKSYDVLLFARLSPQFPYESLSFNMVMNTPSGEERINAYDMKVKSKTGNFVIGCNEGVCEGTLLLKKELSIKRPGKLIIELENLIPRMQVEGISGIGIRVVESGK
jgi:gliding motility-associated lipoprotein GldH